jgi:hypothetical protein
VEGDDSEAVCMAILPLAELGVGLRQSVTGVIAGALAATLASIASPALAWGDPGHAVVALIAYRHLTPAARHEVDRLLASDSDDLTGPDIASRATWADKYRISHRETAAWHFVDIEIDKPDLATACSWFPASPRHAASQGPAKNCVVDKIEEFAAELKDPATPAPERLLALKFVLHFVGDMHQPLHAADHNDKGGNCIGLSPSPDGGVTNLHAFWDMTAVNALGYSAPTIAAKLDSKITPADVRAWSAGIPRDWAMQSWGMAKRDAYNLPSRPTCAQPGAVTLSPSYQATVEADAAHQLSVAGVRLAHVLNGALGGAGR